VLTVLEIIYFELSTLETLYKFRCDINSKLLVFDIYIYIYIYIYEETVI